MNKLFFIALMFSTLACGTSAPVAGGKDKEILIKTVVYCDHCATCEDCKPNIETAINVVKGVKWSRLDVESQTIKVVYSPDKTDEATIRTAIANAGFAADDVPANPDAYAKLDECCKKK